MNKIKVINHIVKWLEDYANNAKVNGFVVGVSGGIDSAVVSTLCAKTGLKTLCIELPIHQAESQVSRAKEHIEQLCERFPNVDQVKVDLTSTFEEFKCVAIDKSIDRKSNSRLDLTLANTRARLRMITLYCFAGLYNYLVVGTGNKIEDFGVGFFTKYGDGGVDISPIADLLKSEVYQLAEILEVPQSIQKARPTDGLFGDNRSDEDQIGATYDELEWAMQMHEEGKTVEDFEGREQEVFTIYIKRNSANKHKMIPIPVCRIVRE